MKNTLTQQPNAANKCCRSFKSRFWGFLVLTWLVSHVSVQSTYGQATCSFVTVCNGVDPTSEILSTATPTGGTVGNWDTGNPLTATSYTYFHSSGNCNGGISRTDGVITPKICATVMVCPGTSAATAIATAMASGGGSISYPAGFTATTATSYNCSYTNTCTGVTSVHTGTINRTCPPALLQNCQQLYAFPNSGAIMYYEPSYDRTTALTATVTGSSMSWTTTSNGDIYHKQPSNGSFRKYSGGAWTNMAIAPVVGAPALASDGTDVYAFFAGSTTSTLYKYNVSTNTWSGMLLSLGPTDLLTRMTSDGTSLFTLSSVAQLRKYSTISPFNWSLSSTAPAQFSGSITHLDGYIYAFKYTAPYALYQYNISANTWAVKANIPFVPYGTTSIYARLGTAGGELYAGDILSKNVYKYNVSTDTWSEAFYIPTTATTFELSASCNFACSPTATATATQNTCTTGTANADGKLTLTAVSGATKVAYNVGSTYTNTATFTTGATTIGALPYDVVATLPNPSVPQPYTVRVFML